MIPVSDLINELLEQKNKKIKGSIYHYSQVKFAYNSNKIEGSKLSEDQTADIFETNSFFPEKDEPIVLDDLNEAKNHFRLFDYMLEHYEDPISKEMMIEMNVILKRGTSYETDPRYNVGGFKVRENYIVSTADSIRTTKPKDVEKQINLLLESYSSIENISINDIIDFHVKFERIHPFGDGNGRVGRMLMFKECLKNRIMPFIITDEYRQFYMRGLKEYDREKGYLADTILFEQDRYENAVNRYLSIYKDPASLVEEIRQVENDQDTQSKEDITETNIKTR